ncbi:MAG: hypothetical protein AAF196_16935 [Planctomycetota bacterium]
MKKVLTLLLAFTLGSCAWLSTEQTLADVYRRPVTRIVERHDAYVEADEDLSAEESERALLESAALAELFETEETFIRRPALRARVAPVLDRYEAYVLVDPELDDFPHRRRNWLGIVNETRENLGLIGGR